MEIAMPRIDTLALALVALFATASSACTAEPMDVEDAQDEDLQSEDTQDENVGSAASALSSYSIASTYTSVQWYLGESVSDYDMSSCSMFPDGVVRSWQLKERNHNDFRYSRHFCRNMGANGTLGSDNDFNYHFYHEGSGTLGMSSVPLDTLPVGVRIQAEYQPFTSPAFKISDVALLYADAADIVALYTGYSQAPYALGRNDSTYTLQCPTGKVITGLGVHEDITSGGSDQSEITGFKIRCSTLSYQ
jgi:hypothetical protein